MSLHPALRSLRAGSPDALLTLEFYIDPVCPFSKRLFTSFYNNVLPQLGAGKYKEVNAIIRPQIQPWHPSSTLTVESLLAVSVLANKSDTVFEYLKSLFDASDKYYDSHTISEPRQQTYERLAKLAGKLVDSKDFANLVAIDAAGSEQEEGKNAGNKVTVLVKWITKLGRQNGIHVTPTVLLNGLVDNEVSSSWQAKEWEEYLDKQLKAAKQPI